MAPVLPDELPLYGVQLVDAYLLGSQVSRRSKREGDDEGPTLEASIGPSQVSDDHKTLDASLGVKVAVPYREAQAYLEIECMLTGRFVSTEERADAFWEAFAGREALAVLWPYVRASVGELGRMTGLRVPLLPTLDVKAIAPSSPPAAKAPAKRRRARSASKPAKAAIG